MREAPVGWQCAACVHEDSKRAPVTRWRPTTRGRLGNTRVTPVVLSLIVINVVVYFWEMASHAGLFVYRGVAYPCSNVAECRFAMWPAAVHHGQWYRLFTAPFLHANIEHILFNMVTLAIVGSPVEAELGKARFIVAVSVVGPRRIGGLVSAVQHQRAGGRGVGRHLRAHGSLFRAGPPSGLGDRQHPGPDRAQPGDRVRVDDD